MNVINLIGNLTRDPEKKATASGTDICNFTVAVQRKYKNKSTGNYECDFIRCTAFRNQADLISRNFAKGSRIGITGTLHIDSKKDEEGRTVTYTEVWVDSVDFCDGIKKREESAPAIDPFEGLEPLDDNDLPF